MALLTRALIFIYLVSAVKATTPIPCVIPPGQYDGQPVNYYDPEPRFGKLCREPGMTQRMENRCLLNFCCTDDCTCDSPNLKDQYTQDANCKNIKILCYKTKNYVRDFKYVCCSGSIYVHENRSCLEPCADNSLGCEHMCAISNEIQQCVCPPGFTLGPDKLKCRDIDECQMIPNLCPERCVNTNGSYKCDCRKGQHLQNGKCVDISTTTTTTTITTRSVNETAITSPVIPVHDKSTTTTRRPVNGPVPQQAMTTAESEKSGLPAPYIAAIAVGCLLLLLLCCLLPLLWFWRRRKRPEPDNSPTDAFGNAVYEKTGLPPYPVTVEKKDKKGKKGLDDEVTVIADDANKPIPPAPTVYATISEKPKDVKPVLDESKKSSADTTQTFNDTPPPLPPTGRKAEANEYHALPKYGGTIRQIVIVDKGGEYAEIRNEKTNV